MVKQVNNIAAHAPAVAAAPQNNNLFISVKTFDPEGKAIGERIVDMYHFGTRNWLQNHHWWAMHNGNCVETNVATEVEVEGYLANAKVQLAAKFNTDVPPKVDVKAIKANAPLEAAAA